jgi:hypothetical protein
MLSNRQRLLKLRIPTVFNNYACRRKIIVQFACRLLNFVRLAVKEDVRLSVLRVLIPFSNPVIDS